MMVDLKMINKKEIDKANEDFQEEFPDCPRLAFETGVIFGYTYNQKEFKSVLQQMESYKVKLGEIAGGVPHK